MKRAPLPYILIPLAALLAVLPLILHGCSCGHDFDFHLVSWLEAAQQFRHGNLHPTWTTTPAWNAGEPRFVFYPPLSWTLGALLGLILPWTWTPIAYTWLALTAAGLSLHRLARAFTTPNAAILAAVVYLANPYTLFTAYERTAYAELLAAAILPLLLHGILRPRITIPGIAVPVALLWLTNAPAAVMGCYALALLAAIRLAIKPDAPYLDSRKWAKRHKLQLALKTAAGTLLGLGLAAFYILPAAYERRYVQIAMATLPGMAIANNFLFHHTGTSPDDLLHDQVLHTASVIAVLLIAATLLLIVITRATTPGAPSSPGPIGQGGVPSEARPPATHLLLPIALLTVTITLLLTPISAFIWRHAPELQFLQFPWRFLAIQAPLLALVVAVALRTLPLKSAYTAVLAIAVAAALVYPAYNVFAQSCDQPDTVQARVALFHSANPGTDPTDEYTPTTADNDSLGHADPPYWLAASPEAHAPANSQPGATPFHLSIDAPTAESLIFNLRDYPAWRITLNGATITMREPREDGLIAIPVPAGSSTLSIAYQDLPDQRIGLILSFISLLLLTLCIARPSFIIKS